MGSFRGLVFLSICLAVLHLSEGNSQYVSDRNQNQRGKLNIIGGNPTTIEKHPYEVSVVIGDDFVAGAILNKNWVLTSAATLSLYANADVKVRVGSNSTDNGGTLYSIQKTVINPYFDINTWSYDMALHKISKPLKFGKTVKSVKLAPKVLKKGQKAINSGWGDTSINGNAFKEIQLSGVIFNDCKNSYATFGYVLDVSQTCARPKDYANGPFYDYGAPLVAKNKLYGLYSFRVIADGVAPIFSRVAAPKTYDWLTKTIKT